MDEDTIISQVAWAPGLEHPDHICHVQPVLVGHEPAIVITPTLSPGDNGEDSMGEAVTITTMMSAITLGAAIDALEVALNSLKALDGDTIEGVNMFFNAFSDDE